MARKGMKSGGGKQINSKPPKEACGSGANKGGYSKGSMSKGMK